MHRFSRSALAWPLLASLAFHASPAGAGLGAVVVADEASQLVIISPETGRQREIVLSPQTQVAALAVTPAGEIVVSDPGALRGRDGEIVVVEGFSGRSLTLARRDLLVDPSAAVVASDGTVYVAGEVQDLVRIAPDSGRQTRLMRLDLLEFRGLALDESERPLLLVGDRDGFRILRLGRDGGAPAVVSEKGLLQDPRGLAVDCRGRIHTLDSSERIVRIRAADGRQTEIARGSFAGVAGLAIDRIGDLLVSDRAGGEGRIRRVDLSTGAVVTLATGGLLDDPGAIGVQPAPSGTDALDMCGGRARGEAVDSLELPAEALVEGDLQTLELRLGRGAWRGQLGPDLPLSGSLETRVKKRRLALVLDAPSQDLLRAWIGQRLELARGSEPPLRDKQGKPARIRLELRRNRARALLTLRSRLEALTDDGIVPIRYRLDDRIRIRGLRRDGEDEPSGERDPGAPPL